MKNIYTDPEKSVMEALDTAVLVEDFLPPPAELVKKTAKKIPLSKKSRGMCHAITRNLL